jgi:hypothetical protein
MTLSSATNKHYDYLSKLMYALNTTSRKWSPSRRPQSVMDHRSRCSGHASGSALAASIATRYSPPRCIGSPIYNSAWVSYSMLSRIFSTKFRLPYGYFSTSESAAPRLKSMLAATR